MGKVNNDNYVLIQGWMVDELSLKGNELLIYAIIYGFSQDGENKFTGSLQYLADWTNSTKQGVLKNIKSLIDKGFLAKEEKHINGVKFCEYHSTKFNGGIKQSLTGGIKQSLPNNIDIDNINNINNCRVSYSEVIDYLNAVCGTSYKSTTKKTQDVIRARCNEGFTLDDFKKVIDNKAAEWLNNPEMCKYLRPETLFGNKFEGYLNQKKAIGGKIEIDNNFRRFLGKNEVVDFGI